ncbi:FGGY-family carbohydrate kinase [Pseudonocardia sp. ICBG1293]|uniref:xylulokinase n=1 Tax=Pseudonocardia sp. ICBG1293 TaxID=2844382 RepID=UPI001CCC2680|nr:FGGY-family carbohydrate kinase [Pseudonocardia sp. ICBG1293]
MSGGRVVAVDVGTSAVRAAVVAGDGTVESSVRVPRSGGVGGEHFDAEQLWSDVVAALGGARSAAPGAVGALGIAGHIGTVAVDRDLRPVGPATGWSDSRGADLVAGLPGPVLRRIRETSGRPVPGAGGLAHALDLLARRPELAGRVQALLSPKDFLLARCVGSLVTDAVHAAYTLLFDVRDRAWDLDLVTELGLPAHWWPSVAAPADPVGGLRADVAAATGLPAGLPVVAGGPDGSVGIGLLLGGRTDLIADVAGTTDVLGRLRTDPEAGGAGVLLNPALGPGRWVTGGPTGVTGGAVARWRELVGTVDEDVVDAVEPGADGLTVIPTLSGDRFPRWRPAARGAVLGQGPDHGPAHLVRAAREGAAFTVREGVDLLDTGTAPGSTAVVLAGGAARSAAAARLRADVLGRTVLVCDDPDVTLLGAAALARAGTGSDLDEALDGLRPRLHRIDPDPVRAARYGSLYASWIEARERIAPAPRPEPAVTPGGGR